MFIRYYVRMYNGWILSLSLTHRRVFLANTLAVYEQSSVGSDGHRDDHIHGSN